MIDREFPKPLIIYTNRSGFKGKVNTIVYIDSSLEGDYTLLS